MRAQRNVTMKRQQVTAEIPAGWNAEPATVESI
jgi:hypothetical protein